MTQLLARTNGLDALCAAGLGETVNEYIMVRAITTDDVIGSSTLNLDTTAMKAANAQEAIVFEVCDIGDRVPERFEEKVGHFTICLATSLNPVNGMALPSRHALVHWETLGRTFSPEDVEAALEWVTNLERKRQEEASKKFS